MGVPLEKGTHLGVYTSWHPPQGEDLSGIYLELRIPFPPASSGIPSLEVIPIYMDVNNVIGETNAYDLPPGRSVRSHVFQLPLRGRLLGVGGHLHDYGMEVHLEDVETGEIVGVVRG